MTRPTTMMMRAACVALCLAVAGCDKNGAIYSVEKPIPADMQSAGAYQIEAHINQATGVKGWRVDKIRPGELRATQDWEGHSITVTILYSAQSYSIRYVSSVNMQERNGTIDRQYNTRVHALEAEIDRRLKPAP